MPSYHDVVVEVNGVKYSMFDGYRHRLQCSHLTGWELLERLETSRSDRVDWTIVGGEYQNNDFRVTVAGHVICEVRREELTQGTTDGI